MLDLFTLKPDAFGLDISDLSLKIIKLKKRGGYLGLAFFSETKIEPGVIEGGQIKQEERLSEIIKEALNKVSGKVIGTKYVIASLPEEKAFLQVIQLPFMAEEEARKAAYFEAENYIPLAIDKVYFDAQMIPAVSQNSNRHSDVLIAALPKNVLDPYVSVLKAAGLKPLALEIESQAVSRALIKKEETDFPALIVDLGATRTGFMVFSGHSLRFTSSKPISSLKFTQLIAQALKVSREKAEGVKADYGIGDSKNGKRILGVLLPALTELVNQIKKYIDYYKTHAAHEHLPGRYKDAGIGKVLLCGGGANLRGLADFLEAQLSVPVELGSPWVNILPKPLKEVPQLPFQESLKYATALGLALRGVKNND